MRMYNQDSNRYTPDSIAQEDEEYLIMVYMIFMI